MFTEHLRAFRDAEVPKCQKEVIRRRKVMRAALREETRVVITKTRTTVRGFTPSIKRVIAFFAHLCRGAVFLVNAAIRGQFSDHSP
jgi:hypothetical protein